MIQKLLEGHPVFACLDPSSREQAARSAISKRYLDEEWIAHYGTSWAYLFLVGKGMVQALKESPGGRSLIVTEIGQGEIFWGISFFIEDTPMPVALVARGETQLYLWDLEDLKPVILRNGCLSWELSRLLITKMQYASQMLDEFAFQPTTGRLARVLLEHYQDAVGESVARDMTLDEMAARIGSTREMVCRHLYQFADRGAINISRTEFRITDLAFLQDLASQ